MPGIVSFQGSGIQQLSILATRFYPNTNQDHLLIYQGRIGNLQMLEGLGNLQALDENTLSNTIVVGSPAVVTWEFAGNRQIYGFVRGRYDHLQIHFWDGSHWQWRDQETPDGTVVDSSPGAITYNEAGVQRLYAFVCGLDGHLHIHYWDGAQWEWTDQGAPNSTTVFDTPAAVAWYDSVNWIIYSFLRGHNGNLFVHYWDGTQWQWEDAGVPPNATVGAAPAAIGGIQNIRAFVQGSDGHLYMTELSVTQVGPQTIRKWVWTDLGTPKNTAVGSAPGVITYVEGNIQRTYVFVRGGEDEPQLHVCYWTGQWKWATQGKPDGTTVADAPGVITYLDSGKQWIYAVVRGGDNGHYINYWNGSQWRWTALPKL